MAQTHPPKFMAEPEIEEALEGAAREHQRSVPFCTETILVEWLRAGGLLQEETSS